jgi:hypothetical protein
MHPLSPDLSTLTDEEVASKFNELSKRLGQAYRSGPSQIIPQIQMLMQDYQQELGNRQQKLMTEMEQRAEKNGKGFKGIIDIS